MAIDTRAVWNLALGAMLIAIPGKWAHAQQESDLALEEVIVTAEKRESTAQDTPIAMSVFSSEDIAENGIGNLQDLAVIAPDVNFAKGYSSSIVTIRGVSSRDTTEIGDPAVSISIDGFSLQRSLSLDGSLFDLERIEVLRGPQGTLYGRNATGGAINFVTAKPKPDFEARAGVGIGNYSLISTEGMLNLPVSDEVKIRASFSTRDHDGYRKNAPALDADDADVQAARLHILFDPTDKLSLLFTGEHQTEGGVGPAMYGVPLITDANGEIVHERPALPKNGKRWPLSLPNQHRDTEIDMARWELNYDFDFATFTYFGGYRSLDFRFFMDLDGVEAISWNFDRIEKLETLTHEMRLASTDNGRFNWQVGGMYFEEKNDLLGTFLTYPDAGPAQELFIFTYPDINAESKAVFGRAGYRPIPELELDAGVRYSKDTKRRVGTFEVVDVFVAPQDSMSDDTKTTYHVGLNWDAAPQSLLYAKYSTGYKAGGFTDVQPYGPETIKAFELGSKNRLLDDRLQLNFAGFYYDYKDQQISQFKDGRTTVFNAGQSESYGFEVDGVAQLSSQDWLDIFVGYLHAEFTEFCTSVEASGACTPGFDFEGNAPPQAPHWQLGAGFEHSFPLQHGTLKTRVQSRYQSESYFTFNNFDSERQGSYTRSDIIVTYTFPDDRLALEAYVRNLENEVIVTRAEEQSFFGAYIYQFNPPRTFGARLTVNW